MDTHTRRFTSVFYSSGDNTWSKILIVLQLIQLSFKGEQKCVDPEKHLHLPECKIQYSWLETFFGIS